MLPSFRVDHLRLPLGLAGARVERDQLVVGGGDVDAPGAVGDAAADRLRQLELRAGEEVDRRRVGPADLAGGGVDGEDLVDAGVVVHRAADHDREGLPGALPLAAGAGPGDLQVGDVVAVDLVEVGEVGVLGDVAPARPADVRRSFDHSHPRSRRGRVRSGRGQERVRKARRSIDPGPRPLGGADDRLEDPEGPDPVRDRSPWPAPSSSPAAAAAARARRKRPPKKPRRTGRRRRRRSGRRRAGEEARKKNRSGSGGGERRLGGEGKTIFTTNCGSCHTLKAAGTSGEVGPNLDELKPDEATVEKQVDQRRRPDARLRQEGILDPRRNQGGLRRTSPEAGKAGAGGRHVGQPSMTRTGAPSR